MSQQDVLHALLHLPRAFVPLVSPDGKWVAWSWFGKGTTVDVYAAPVDGSRAPIRLSESDEEVILISWAPDSASVVVGQDHEGDERVQLFRVALDQPGAMFPLTPAEPNYFIHGGQLHPHQPWLIYAANLDPETEEEIEQTCIYRHDLQTGERTLLARPEKGGYVQLELNDQGSHILYNRLDRHPSGVQYWLVDIDGAEDREILNAGDSAKVDASWMPDGVRVVVVADAENYRRVGVWSRENDELRWLIDDPQRSIEFAFAPHGTDRPLIVVGEIQGARTTISLYDLESDTETRLPQIAGDLIPLRQVDEQWIGSYSSSTHPYDIVRFRLDDLRPEAFVSLTRLWEQTELSAEQLAPAEDLRWRSVDGLEIQGWLYRPKGEPKGTIVYVHGGPTAHSADSFHPEVQYYVSQGFNVLLPNYRGSTGFGLAFKEAIKAEGWGGLEQDDIRAGIEAMLERGIAQPGKVGITGTSYGGYSSWCQITRCPPEILAAAAPVCGMTDLVVDYYTTRPDLRPYSEEMMGGTPEQQPERYRKGSPIHFVDQIKGNLLIVQGMRDPNVTPDNVRVVVDALQTANVEYQVLTFEDEGHGISRIANRAVLYKQLADFFARSFNEEL
jgi:dipeptidyl aminopeptidase/acylaminoacyl peptidase